MSDSVLSPADRHIVLAALADRLVKLERFIDECEAVPVRDRKFPTDLPDAWRERLDETKALYERLSDKSSMEGASGK